eukprot:4298366-Ditylum_brightwellii.AAC.1
MAGTTNLKITNQKNGRMGETIHLPMIQEVHSQVKVPALQIHHILKNGGTDDTFICMYSDGNGFTTVTPGDMILMLHKAVTSLQLSEKGIDPDLIGIH